MLAYIHKIPENQRAEFQLLVYELSYYLRCPADHLMIIMHFESGGTFSPSKPNGFGYYGLIQFGSAAAQDLGTTTAQLVKMSHVQQMRYVIKYFELRVKKFGKPKHFADLYLYVNYPNWVNFGPNDKLPASEAYLRNNSGLTNNKKGDFVSKQSIYNTFNERYGNLLYVPGQSSTAIQQQETAPAPAASGARLEIDSIMPLIELMVIVSLVKPLIPASVFRGKQSRAKNED